MFLTESIHPSRRSGLLDRLSRQDEKQKPGLYGLVVAGNLPVVLVVLVESGSDSRKRLSAGPLSGLSLPAESCC